MARLPSTKASAISCSELSTILYPEPESACCASSAAPLSCCVCVCVLCVLCVLCVMSVCVCACACVCVFVCVVEEWGGGEVVVVEHSSAQGKPVAIGQTVMKAMSQQFSRTCVKP